MEKMVTGIIILVVVGFVLFALKKVLKQTNVNPVENMKEVIPNVKKALDRKPVLYKCPMLYSRLAESKPWNQTKILQPEYSVGKGRGVDYCVDLPYFADRQFVIRKVNDGNDEYFTLTNYGKVNRTEYFDQENNCFPKMEYKDEILLDGREVFYVGDVKFTLDVPEMKRKPRESDWLNAKQKERVTILNRETSDRKTNDAYEAPKVNV